jgi:hypothetical protein
MLVSGVRIQYSEQSSPSEEIDSDSVDDSYGNEFNDQESSSSDDGNEVKIHHFSLQHGEL